MLSPVCFYKSLCCSESWVTNIIANDLCSGIIALNKVNQDQFNQERHVTKSHLHTDPCISAGKRNTTHVLEQKYVCLWYQKGHSFTGGVKPLEEAALSPKLRSTALNWGFLQRAGSTCLDFSITIWAHFQHTAIFHNEITAFIYNFSLKLRHFRKASYYAAWRCTSEPQHWWLAAKLMDIAAMHLTDRPTLFVKTKSTYMPKELWYNWRKLMGKKPHHLFLQRNERGPDPPLRRQRVRGQCI